MKRGFIILLVLMLSAAGCRDAREGTGNTDEEIVSMPEAEEKEEGPKEYKVEMSSKLSDFQFAIDGKVWSIPSKMEEWSEDGWQMDEKKEESALDIESYVEGETLRKDKTALNVDIVNLDSEKKRLKDCYVGGICLESVKDGAVYQLPGGITLGKSTLNEVLKAYGAPSDEYEEKEDIYLTYPFGIYKEAEFVFDIEKEIVSKVSLKNYRETDTEEQEISKEEPDEVKNYTDPEGFSQEPRDYIVSYDHAWYKVPAPVSRFLKNGWKIEKDGSDAYVKAGRHGYVTLEKGEHTLYAVVKNYAGQAVEIENTFVTNLSGDFDVTKVPIAVGEGVTLGVSEEDMKSALGGASYETEEEEKGTAYYLYSDETKKNFIKIFVDRDLRLVREIQVSNSPETLSPVQEGENQDTPDSAVMGDENSLPDSSQEE